MSDGEAASELELLNEVWIAARQFLLADLDAVHAQEALGSYQDRFVKNLVPGHHVDLAKHEWSEKEKVRLAARNRLIAACDAVA